MIGTSEFFQIARDSVKHWPNSPAWKRVNTFSYLIRRGDLLERALGRSYDDFLKGYFWSRDWVLGGADPNEMEKQYGIFFIEKMDIDFNCEVEYGKESVKRLAINSMLIRDCNDCPGGLRSVGEVEEGVEDNLWVFLKYLDGVGLYTVSPPAGSDYDAWLNKDHVAYLITQGYNFVEKGRYLKNYMNAPGRGGRYEVVLTDFELGENVVSAMMEMDVKFCSNESVNFDFDFVDSNRVGVVSCC